MVAHEKRNSGQLFCTVPTRNDLALSSLLFTAQPTKKLGYPPYIRPGKRRTQKKRHPKMPLSVCFAHSLVCTLMNSARSLE